MSWFISLTCLFRLRFEWLFTFWGSLCSFLFALISLIQNTLKRLTYSIPLITKRLSWRINLWENSRGECYEVDNAYLNYAWIAHSDLYFYCMSFVIKFYEDSLTRWKRKSKRGVQHRPRCLHWLLRLTALAILHKWWVSTAWFCNLMAFKPLNNRK